MSPRVLRELFVLDLILSLLEGKKIELKDTMSLDVFPDLSQSLTTLFMLGYLENNVLMPTSCSPEKPSFIFPRRLTPVGRGAALSASWQSGGDSGPAGARRTVAPSDARWRGAHRAGVRLRSGATVHVPGVARQSHGCEN